MRNKRVGRKPIFQEQFLDSVQGLPSTLCRRALVNRAYGELALGALKRLNNKNFDWIIGTNPKITILEELGRLAKARNFSIMIQTAHQLSELSPRPNVKRCIAILRNFRLKQYSRTGSAEDLAREISSLISNFINRYPGTPKTTILTSLELSTSDQIMNIP